MSAKECDNAINERFEKIESEISEIRDKIRELENIEAKIVEKIVNDLYENTRIRNAIIDISRK